MSPRLVGEFDRWVGDEPLTHVVVGDCRDVLSYEILDRAFRAVHGGAQVVALQHAPLYQAADGDHLDTGAVVAALEFATGVPSLVVGKPSAAFFELAASTTAVPPRRFKGS